MKDNDCRSLEMKYFWMNVDKLLLNKGMSDLAISSGIPLERLQQMRIDQNDPRADEAVYIARFLGTTVRYLFNQDGDCL